VTRPGIPSRSGVKNANSMIMTPTTKPVSENMTDETALLPGMHASATSTT